MRTIRLKPKVRIDLTAAKAWYDEQRDGLGREFVLDFENALGLINRMPSRFREVKQGYRRALLRRFPYVVFFRYDESEIVVIGVYHAKRDPKVWSADLGSDETNDE